MTEHIDNSHSLKELLLRGNSRSYTDFVGSIAGQRRELVPQLWEIYLSMEEPVARRAAWILDTSSEKDDSIALPFLEQLIQQLGLFGHDGLKRHGLRMIDRYPFPEGCTGTLTDICFRWLLSGSESVAVKMYCMLILYRISKTEPDILPELYDTIEFQMADSTPGVQSISQKMLREIDRDMIMLKTQKK